MVLRSGFILIAQKLQEAADMAHSNVRSMLSDAVHDSHKGTGKWASYVDHTGDGESGDCIFNCDGDMKSAPYEIASVGGKKTANLDTSNAKKVVPMTTYAETADDDDHYAAMESAQKAAKLYDTLPLYERFISKKERDSADEGDFAGKGKSFPILKPSDVGAAVHAMGRAGSDNLGMAALKARIIAIAKRKGWTSELPKSWQDGGEDKAAKEAARLAAAGTLKLNEATSWKDDALSLIEAAGGAQEMELKLIAPGKGSSAFYPAEVLKRDGPSVFAKNTQIYINHATHAEESQRPEGDWHKLAGALSTDAYWSESHSKGPGLYAKALFTSDYAPLVKEKAAFSGMSIRANGSAAQESGRTVMKEGVPVLAKLTSAESVDVVTRAGAGGMILTESQRIAANEGDDMSEDEKKRLFEAARIVEQDTARRIATSALADLSLTEAGKSMAVDNVLRMGIPMANGVLDQAKLTESVKEEAGRIGAFIAQTIGTGVRGMGSAPAVALTEKEEKQARKAAKRLQEANASVFSDLMGDGAAASFAAQGRVN
jgi:hypothetical protein